MFMVFNIFRFFGELNLQELTIKRSHDLLKNCSCNAWEEVIVLLPSNKDIKKMSTSLKIVLPYSSYVRIKVK